MAPVTAGRQLAIGSSNGNVEEIGFDPRAPIAKAVEAANIDPILMAFNVEAEGKKGSAVIDVTRLGAGSWGWELKAI